LKVSLKVKKRNEVVRKTLGVACITDKIQVVRLREGHAMRLRTCVDIGGVHFEHKL